MTGMNGKNPTAKILHVWDTKVNSNLNIDDLLQHTSLIQKSIARVFIASSKEIFKSQTYQHLLSQIVSPYPEGLLRRIVSRYRFRRLLLDEIEDFGPDIIFVHFGQTAASLMTLLMRQEKTIVVALYGQDIGVGLRKIRWRIKYRIFPKSGAKFLVLSEDVKSKLIALNVDPSLIAVYNYPINVRPYLKVVKSTNDGLFRITIPGRLVEKKGHRYLFEAMKILRTQEILTHLNVVGYGENLGQFQELAITFGIESQITWIDTSEATIHGRFDDLYSEVLAQTDLVVLPCVTSDGGDIEAGPALVLCLAQIAGVPVLTTPFSGHEVSIVNGRTGFTVNERDVNELANKIAWCINNSFEVETIASQAREHALKVFDQERDVAKLGEILLEDFL